MVSFLSKGKVGMQFKERPGFVMLDGRKLYAALLAVKQVTNMSWENLCQEVGIARSPIGHLRDGGSIDATTFLRMLLWLDEKDPNVFAMTEKGGGA